VLLCCVYSSREEQLLMACIKVLFIGLQGEGLIITVTTVPFSKGTSTLKNLEFSARVGTVVA